MQIKFAFAASFLFAVILILGGCVGDRNGVAPINPNGDSELALLMREMFDDAMRMKGEVEQGKLPDVEKNFESMLTAEATEPEKVATQAYKLFSDSYLESLHSLKEANLGEVSSSFNSMVQNCMNCHQAMCPGPMVRIEKLYVNKKVN